MSGDTDNPRIWINGDVLTAPLGSTAPTGVVADWAAAWEPLGLMSEDGMVESRADEQKDHYAWGGVLIRTTRSKHKRTFKVIALEDNAVVFALVNPGSDADDAGGVTTRTVVVPQTDIRMFGVETADGDIVRRLVIPRGEVTAVGDITSSDSEMTMYELTITVYPDADRVLYTEISNNSATSDGS